MSVAVRHYGDMPERPELTERDRAILDLEFRDVPRGSKEDEIRRTFGISPARYYQLVNGLLDHPEAIAYWPVEMGRLRRLRDSRTAQRNARVFG